MKTIPGHPNYAITKDGRVWSKPRITSQGHELKGKFRKLILDKLGRLRIDLWCDGKYYKCSVHRLVLETYVGPCPEGMECRHLDGDPLNNNLDNLCWGTKSENSLDSIRHGTHAGLNCKGEKHPNAKLYKEQVQVIFHAFHDGTYSIRELANYFKVAYNTVWQIVRGKRWKHLYAQI